MCARLRNVYQLIKNIIIIGLNIPKKYDYQNYNIFEAPSFFQPPSLFSSSLFFAGMVTLLSLHWKRRLSMEILTHCVRPWTPLTCMARMVRLCFPLKTKMHKGKGGTLQINQVCNSMFTMEKTICGCRPLA